MLFALIAGTAIVASAAAPASAARNLVTGFADSAFRASDATERNAAYDKAVSEGAGIVRINVIWREVVGPNPPANPSDPGDPAYNFSEIDEAVLSAAAHNVDVMFTVYGAPQWAEGPHRPDGDEVPAGTWKPDPKAFGDFGRALAARFSGAYTPAGLSQPLPAVKDYEAWNEENLWLYLTPQYDGKKKETAVDLYRKLLNAFYVGVHEVDDGARVLLGGNAPFGDDPGGLRTRPLPFLRQLLCLTKSLEPRSCPVPAKFDILGVHPINTGGGPTRRSRSNDDAPTQALPRVVATLRAAEKLGTVAGGRHAVWSTEFWWESFPDRRTVPLAKHGRFVEQAMYLIWKAGSRVAINLQLTDTPASSSDELRSTLQAGVFFADGTPKPAATAFRFPFVTDRRSKSKSLAWGKSPLAGKLTIEQKRKGDWAKVKSIDVKANRVFTTTIKGRGRADYRATIGDQTSLVWTQRK